MAGDLFRGLPPPAAAAESQQIVHASTQDSCPRSQILAPPASALKSALKRPNPQSQAAPEKRLQFKTSTDASEKQVIEAMQKIASHIKNPSKFTKASKLAIQLIQAGSVKEATSDYFFSILEASMSSIASCNELAVRADYHTLFSAAQDVAECLKTEQQNLLNIWMIRAVFANDLFTDDSFVFSKATGRIKDLISSLPLATKEDDIEEEAVALKNETSCCKINADGQLNEELSRVTSKEGPDDPFGLDALISKEEKTKRKKELISNMVLLKLQREALVSCLEIAAKRYKIPWCQTAIDILVKYASDNIRRFTSQQRDAIAKLWASIREQQTRRKQGKSVSGKLDVNAFEWLQQKYANEKISIRHSVGGSGDRQCQQWLG